MNASEGQLSSSATAFREAFGDRKLPDISRKITACVACRKLKVDRDRPLLVSLVILTYSYLDQMSYGWRPSAVHQMQEARPTVFRQQEPADDPGE
jgi:hypothetical protein